MSTNRPSHATTSAPVTAPAPENAIIWLYSPDTFLEHVLGEHRQEREQRHAEERRQEGERGQR